MSPIRILPTKLVNQIAAGEVVERPASVVKELLENAVDAQAGRISVEVEAGGKKLVRISDDGLGMSPEDVAVVFRSHATSKLADAEGLYRIRSLGFRGEAMASIGSVAHVLLVSRSQDADEAAQVDVRGGDIGTPRVAGAGAGTTVEVRNLFYNVPARRKFLKTDATEMGHIIEQFTRVALAYPTVGMSLKHNGRHVHELPPGTLLERVGAFFGGELASALHPIKVDEKEVNLWGFIAPPSLSRATTKMQYLFINGRYIRDRSLFHAIREGYRGLLEGQRQPIVFLFLTVAPDRVDVNVHPTKIEVNLRDGNLIYGLLLATIREKLLGASMQPHLAPRPAAGAAPDAPVDPTARGRGERVERSLAEFFKSSRSSPQQSLKFPVGRCASSPGAAPGARAPAVAFEAPRRAPGAPLRDAGLPGDAPPVGPEAPVKAFQLHNAYLVAETAEGMVIIDQHALHERILYERIMGRLGGGALESQRLLVPETVEVTESEFEVLESCGEMLGRLGMTVGRLGPRTAGIQAAPTFMRRGAASEFLRNVLDWAAALDKPPDLASAIDEVAHMLACHGAVKAGERLDEQEIASLLVQLDDTERSSRCPHGRPTTLRFTKADLERQFGRR